MSSAVSVIRSRLRAGGRFVLFAVAAVLVLGVHRAVLHAIPATAAVLERARSGGSLPVWHTLVSNGGAVLLVLGLTAVAARLERRSLADHGLPLRAALGSLFRRGALWGLVMATLVMAATWLLDGVSFAPPSLSVAGVACYAMVWAISFVVLGVTEELLIRGYALSALGQAIGFWPAATLLAGVFGALHLSNSGENVVGALNVVVYSLFAAFTLRRTGNLWFAIGIHAAWDYAQAVLYGVPASGVRHDGQILQAELHGPAWLTGSTAGPEGSALGFVVLALAFVVFAWRFPARPAGPATPPHAAPPSTVVRTDAAAIA
jgi:membrane protease YdiL (CAAX protease family)